MKKYEELREKHKELATVMRYLSLPENKDFVPPILANKVLDEATEIFMRTCEIYNGNLANMEG